jgi:hypothetical protein
VLGSGRCWSAKLKQLAACSKTGLRPPASNTEKSLTLDHHEREELSQVLEQRRPVRKKCHTNECQGTEKQAAKKQPKKIGVSEIRKQPDLALAPGFQWVSASFDGPEYPPLFRARQELMAVLEDKLANNDVIGPPPSKN